MSPPSTPKGPTVLSPVDDEDEEPYLLSNDAEGRFSPRSRRFFLGLFTFLTSTLLLSLIALIAFLIIPPLLNTGPSPVTLLSTPPPPPERGLDELYLLSVEAVRVLTSYSTAGWRHRTPTVALDQASALLWSGVGTGTVWDPSYESAGLLDGVGYLRHALCGVTYLYFQCAFTEQHAEANRWMWALHQTTTNTSLPPPSPSSFTRSSATPPPPSPLSPSPPPPTLDGAALTSHLSSALQSLSPTSPLAVQLRRFLTPLVSHLHLLLSDLFPINPSALSDGPYPLHTRWREVELTLPSPPNSTAEGPTLPPTPLTPVFATSLFDPTDFIALLRENGRSLWMGDSLSDEAFQSLRCSLPLTPADDPLITFHLEEVMRAIPPLDDVRFVVYSTGPHWHLKRPGAFPVNFTAEVKAFLAFLHWNWTGDFFYRPMSYAHPLCTSVEPTDIFTYRQPQADYHEYYPDEEVAPYNWKEFPLMNAIWKREIEALHSPRLHFLDMPSLRQRIDSHGGHALLGPTGSDCLHYCLPHPAIHAGWEAVYFHLKRLQTTRQTQRTLLNLLKEGGTLPPWG